MSSKTTEAGEERRVESEEKEESSKDKGKQQFPSKMQIPSKASTSLEVSKAGLARILERKRVPTKRYGLDE